METVAYLALGFAALSCLVATAAVLHKIFRPRFPVKVNCWFCNRDTEVPYGNQVCWDCPHCEQYNGFTQDGDYNKPIPSQFIEEFNHPVTPERKSASFNSSSDVLCYRCQTNQLLKVRQLANFVPISETSYELEVEVYKARLEETYSLCKWCEQKVYEVLDKQDRRLRKTLDRHGVSLSSDCDHENDNLNLSDISATEPVSLHQSSWLLAAHTLVLLVALTMCAGCVENIVSPRVTGLLSIIQRVLHTLHQQYLIAMVIAVLAGSLSIMYMQGMKRTGLADVLTVPVLLAMIVISTPLSQTMGTYECSLIQTILSLLVTLLHVWSLTDSVDRNPVIRIQTKKSRNSLGSSGMSPDPSPGPSLVGDDEDEQSIAQSEEEECFSDFEIMSLGTPPKRARKHIFNIYASTPDTQSDRPTSSTSPFLRAHPSPRKAPLHLHRNNSPLISPARFKHHSAPERHKQLLDACQPSTSKARLGTFNTSRLPPTGFGLGGTTNSLTRGSSGWKSGAFSQSGWSFSLPEQVTSDSGSVFSEPRSMATVYDREDSCANESRSSSVCPVDTTYTEPQAASLPRSYTSTSIPQRHQTTSNTTFTVVSAVTDTPRAWIRRLLVLSLLVNFALFSCYVDAGQALDTACSVIVHMLGTTERFFRGFQHQLSTSTSSDKSHTDTVG